MSALSKYFPSAGFRRAVQLNCEEPSYEPIKICYEFLLNNHQFYKCTTTNNGLFMIFKIHWKHKVKLALLLLLLSLLLLLLLLLPPDGALTSVATASRKVALMRFKKNRVEAAQKVSVEHDCLSPRPTRLQLVLVTSLQSLQTNQKQTN